MKNSTPTSVNEEFEQMIREGQIMLRGNDPEQRERGRQKLREVVRLAEGSIYAQCALEILTTAEPRIPEPINPELDELMKLWPSIQGFNDYRLVDFLRRLEACQGMAVPLRTEVVRELRRWIVDELPGVGTGVSSTKIETLNDFVAAVRGVAAFEELPEFSQLRDRLFQKRLQETATSVDASLSLWTIEEAQRLLDHLSPFPGTFRVNVERLQAEIDEAGGLRRTLDRLLQEIPVKVPENWFEARLQAELQRQLEEYRTNNRVPQDWRLRLEQAVETLANFISGFVRGQAHAAVTIPLLRNFWSELQRLNGPAEVGEHWFAEVEDALTVATRRDVERAVDIGELVGVANRLRADAEGIPPFIASRIIEIAESITRTGTIWKSMREGQSFVLSSGDPNALPLPRALSAESERYSVWAQQVEAVLSSFVNEALLSKQDYYDSLRLAESILAEVPHHALALKLQQEATRRLTCYQLDRALSSWDVDSFFKLCETDNPSEIYRALIVHKDVLVELRDLTQQQPLKNWRGAGDWWARWQAALKRLPIARPDALITALDHQSSQRRLERYATLERLLQDNVTPQEYEGAATSLDDETDSSLKSYQQELLRRAAIVRIEKHIKSGHLDDATLELANLPPTSTDAIRLRTRLEVEQSRLRGSGAVADYVFQEWENVRAYVDQPEKLLLETITAVWMDELHDAVVKMSRLISRLLRETTESESTQELVDWQTWLEIEQGLFNSFSSVGVKQLADYLRSAERGQLLDMRLKKVVEHWQKENHIVMLAWAYQAFRRISTVANQFDGTAAELVERGDQIANDVERVLSESATLELDDLKPLQASLQLDEERWRLLDDYLSLLSHSVEHAQPSPTLIKAKQRMSEVLRILTLLASLKDADLRQGSPAQNYNDAYSRALRLRGVGSRGHMLEQLERLRPLREELFSLQQRIHETAERCRSKEALNVLEPSLFHRLAGYVRQAVEIFVTAGAHGGAMWTLVSAEYESQIYQEACVLLSVSGSSQLDQLVDILEELHAEELNFSQALSLLEDRDRQPKVAGGGAFDPKPHLEYFALIPQREPRTLKVYHRFERARRDTLKLILEAPESRPHLPVWVLNYLDNGVPTCANGR